MDYIISLFPTLLQGAVETLKIFALVLVLALPLGLPLAFGAMSKNINIKAIANTYILIFRGTPLLLQLYFFYFTLPIMFQNLHMEDFKLDRFPTAILTFVLNYSAYFAEIYRSGIQSIDKGQSEACVSLGYSKIQTLRYVIMPQVIQRIIPPISNEVITLVKDTALVNVIAVPELLKSTRGIVNKDANPLAFALAALIYLILIAILTAISRMLEKRFSRHENEVV